MTPNTKHIRDLKNGDIVGMDTGSATVRNCERAAIFDGNLYEVTTDKGTFLHDGLDVVAIVPGETP